MKGAVSYNDHLTSWLVAPVVHRLERIMTCILGYEGQLAD